MCYSPFARFAGTDNDVVDLHGTTVAEAVTIVKEVLGEGWTSQCEHTVVVFSSIFQTEFPARPLKVITGKGSHSVNGIGILNPAIRNALRLDGWNLIQRDGEILVYNKT